MTSYDMNKNEKKRYRLVVKEVEQRPRKARRLHTHFFKGVTSILDMSQVQPVKRFTSVLVDADKMEEADEIEVARSANPETESPPKKRVRTKSSTGRKKRARSPMKFTDQQLLFVEYPHPLKKGVNLRVRARAGTGKSHCIRGYMMRRPERNFLYWVYNVTMAEEAVEAMQACSNCTISTIHATCFDHVTNKLKMEFCKQQDTFITQVMNLIKQEKLSIREVTLKYALEGLERYFNSADDEIEEVHYSMLWPNARASLGADRFSAPPLVVAQDWGKRIMQWIMEKKLPVTFSAMMKVAQLTLHDLGDKYPEVMVDEGQDMFPVVTKLLLQQNWGIVIVGDERQGINGWNGAKDALDKIKCIKTFTFTKSWRFGQRIAEMVNALFEFSGDPLEIPMEGAGPDTQVKLIGLDQNLDSMVCQWAKEQKDVAYLCRSNKNLIENMESVIAYNDATKDKKQRLTFDLSSSLQQYMEEIVELCDCDEEQLNTMMKEARIAKDFDLVTKITYAREKGAELQTDFRMELDRLSQLEEIRKQRQRELQRKREDRLKAKSLSDIDTSSSSDDEDATSNSDSGDDNDCPENTQKHLLTVSDYTAHSSKGLQWGKVYVGSDIETSLFKALDISKTTFTRLKTAEQRKEYLTRYLDNQGMHQIDMETIYLVYVTITRVQHELALPHAMHDLLESMVETLKV